MNITIDEWINQAAVNPTVARILKILPTSNTKYNIGNFCKKLTMIVEPRYIVLREVGKPALMEYSTH